jgi:hypothetical protein
MKSGGVLASPTNANALPGSDKLVPKTTIPEKRDWAPAHAGAASINAVVQPMVAQRMNDMRALVIMT